MTTDGDYPTCKKLFELAESLKNFVPQRQIHNYASDHDFVQNKTGNMGNRFSGQQGYSLRVRLPSLPTHHLAIRDHKGRGRNDSPLFSDLLGHVPFL